MNDPIFLSRRHQITFSDPRLIVSTHQVSQVKDALQEIEEYVERGHYAAGFIAYEAAPAFDPAFIVHPPGDFPLLWFGIYDKMERTGPVKVRSRPFTAQSPWRPRISKADFLAGFHHIRENIIAGQCYQVNYTFPLEGTVDTPSQDLLYQLYHAQPVDYAAYIHLENYDIVSLSPELFWRLEGNRIVCKPMKGTRARDPQSPEDQQVAAELQHSPKDRAENLMIVDMVRNDLGRIARIGSVNVDQLFELEDYQTVWQMTSTISAETDAGIPDIMSALFPSASVTGAPKIKSVEIIHRVEPHPRHVYCGTVGWWAPGRQTCFNVGIRMLIRRKCDNKTRYYVGSGITVDSIGEKEYDECLAKAAVLHPQVRLAGRKYTETYAQP